MSTIRKYYEAVARPGAVHWNVIYGVFVLLVANAGLYLFWPHATGFGYSTYRAAGLAIGIGIAACAPVRILRAWSHAYVVIAYVAWSVLSTLWAPSITKASLQSLQLVELFVVTMGMMIHLGRIRGVLVVGGALTVASTASLLLMLVAPKLSFISVLHPDAGATLQGIGVFGWNSELGIAAAIAALVNVCSLLLMFRKRTIAYLAINVTALVLSDSATSLFALAAGAVVILLLRFRVARFATAGMAVLAVLAGFIVGWGKFTDVIFSAVGRSSNLTGREAIWRATIDQITLRPVQGYGIGASADYLHLIGRSVGHAHNGFLQLTYERGLIGLVLFAAMVTFAVVRMFIGARQTLRWYLPLLVLVLVANYANNFITDVTLAGFVIVWVVAASTSADGDRGRAPLNGSIDANRAPAHPDVIDPAADVLFPRAPKRVERQPAVGAGGDAAARYALNQSAVA